MRFEYLLVAVAVMFLSACAKPQPTPRPTIVVPEGLVSPQPTQPQDPAGTNMPAGDTITFDEGDTITLGFDEHPGTTYYLNVDGLGPAGVMFRGVSGILKVGDPIRRDIDGKLYELGIVKEINTQDRTVTVLLYDTAIIVENE
jgi:hypothetical protein